MDWLWCLIAQMMHLSGLSILAMLKNYITNRSLPVDFDPYHRPLKLKLGPIHFQWEYYYYY